MTKKLRTVLIGLRNRNYLVLDLILIALSPWIALVLRVDSFREASPFFHPLLIYSLLGLGWKPLVFYLSGIYERYWIYASTDAILVLLAGTGASLVIEVFLALFVFFPAQLLVPQFPRSLPFMNGAIVMALVCTSRLAVRLAYERMRRGAGTAKTPILIVGAGVSGSMVGRELRTNPDLHYEPMGFLDDNPQKEGLFIHGIPVLGPLAKLEAMVKAYGVKEIIIAIPAAPGSVVRAVDHACKRAGVKSKTIPGIFELLNGTARFSQIRDIQIEDILRRGVVQTDPIRVTRLLTGARVMVTGAGGSIGSELCRQIIGSRPSDLILVGHGENSIFGIANELKKHAMVEDGDTRLHSVIADIRDEDRMERVLKHHRPQVVFHAAAHKHVGLMEGNLQDAVSNNVLGTRTLVDLSAEFDVQHFVMISSDKAVNPSSVMGVTKRVAELIVQESAMRTGRSFVSVRFGNVLGSRGSVIPIFKEQIASGGPVLVTHPRATRFFMTIPEAVQLVLQAATLGKGGEVFVLDMGQPIRILDLVRDVIRLSGLKEGEDLEIKFTGLTRGEKLHEELFYDFEEPEQSDHGKIFVCRNHIQRSLEKLLSRAGIAANVPGSTPKAECSVFRREVDRLIVTATVGEKDEALACIRRIVPQYMSGEQVGLEERTGEMSLRGQTR